MEFVVQSHTRVNRYTYPKRALAFSFSFAEYAIEVWVVGPFAYQL